MTMLLAISFSSGSICCEEPKGLRIKIWFLGERLSGLSIVRVKISYLTSCQDNLIAK